MARNRLSAKLLAGAIGLVDISALAVASWATYHYSQSLRQSFRDQCFLLGHSLAADPTDLILTQHVVALQKMVQHPKTIHPDLAYLFVQKDGKVLAHSFDGGVRSIFSTSTSSRGSSPLVPERWFRRREIGSWT